MTVSARDTGRQLRGTELDSKKGLSFIIEVQEFAGLKDFPCFQSCKWTEVCWTLLQNSGDQ